MAWLGRFGPRPARNRVFASFFPSCRDRSVPPNRAIARLVWTAPATGGELAPAPHLSKTAFGGKGGGVY